MALTTQPVTVQVSDQNGAGISWALVTATLTRSDRDPDNGWVLPQLVSGTTDALGLLILTLWPNALGSDGSQYRFTADTSDGVRLFDVLATVPDAPCDLASLAITTDDMPPWPAADSTREDRLVQDIADLLQEPTPSAETQRKVKRWIALVLQHMASMRRWKFLENLVATTMGPGVESIDLTGDLAAVIGLYGPNGRIVPVTLNDLAVLRATATPGFARGEVSFYAIEAGRRLHFWPAPDKDTVMALHYQRPMVLTLVPSDLEQIIVHGVLGRYGQHWDRDALTQNPAEFEARYMRDLVNAGRDSWDSTLVSMPEDRWTAVRSLGYLPGTTVSGTVALP
jgi:hypothetical protein